MAPIAANKYNKLTGKHVLVVGGTSGIGYAVAEASIENGARVTVSSSREASVKTTLERLSKSYPDTQVAGYACDLSKPSVEADVEALFQKVGTVDHVVYTAGDKLSTIPFQQITMEYFVKAGQLRFFAPFFVAKVGSRYLSAGPTSSITITGGGIAERPLNDWAVVGSYAAGLYGLVRSLALELKPVRVNLVQPGGLATDLWRDMEPHKREALYRHWSENFPTGEVGQAEDVAEAYLWLMKDKNVTGRVAGSDSGHSLI
jgi:NAD(P)-dependent dehydrogenase (short-subunit alcohol dehydrogenase family)